MSGDVRVCLFGGAFVGALVMSLVLTRLARAAAPRVGYVDRPGGHKSHRAPIPYGGGVAIFLSAWLPCGAALLAAPFVSHDWIARTFGEGLVPYVGGIADRAPQGISLLLGAAALHLLGLFDDVRALGAWPKLVVIVGVALMVALVGDVRLVSMWGLPISVALTVAWFVVIINAFNFLDNMDGLSAGIALICMTFFVVCGVMAGQVLVPTLACCFLGAVGGFWVFNFPPARIFMGDAGSLLVGYMLAVLAVMTTYYESESDPSPYDLAMPLVILAIPLYDFASVITIRLTEGRNPMQGDQRHFSHRLVARGLSRRYAVLTIYLATATTGLASTLLPGGDLQRTLTVVAIVLMVLAIVAILESPLRRAA